MPEEVARCAERLILERASDVRAELDLPFAVEVLCYTPEAFSRKRRELGIVRTALEEGVRLDGATFVKPVRVAESL